MFWNVRAIPSADARVRRQRGNVRAAQQHLAGGQREQPADQVDDGALARAVRPDQAEDLALRDREIDIVDRAHAAEMLGQAFELKHRRAPCCGRCA